MVMLSLVMIQFITTVGIGIGNLIEMGLNSFKAILTIMLNLYHKNIVRTNYKNCFSVSSSHRDWCCTQVSGERRDMSSRVFVACYSKTASK